MKEIELDISGTYGFSSPYECIATLVLEASVETEIVNGKFFGKDYTDSVITNVIVENAMIFVTNQDGGTTREIELDINEVFEYVDTDDIIEQLGE